MAKLAAKRAQKEAEVEEAPVEEEPAKAANAEETTEE